MRDTVVKGMACDSSATLKGSIVAKVMPEAQTNLGQQNTTTAAAVVEGRKVCIAFLRSYI